MIAGTPKTVFFATLSNKQTESQNYERDTRGISVTQEVPGTLAPSSRSIGNSDLHAVLPDTRTPHISKTSVREGEVQVNRIQCPAIRRHPVQTKRNRVSTAWSKGDGTRVLNGSIP